MELLGHDFFVFFNVNQSQINVVYKRRDGDYALIQPELA
jgi:putative sigma-54 modulation protein